MSIQSRIGDGSWQTTSAIYPLKGQVITLKVEPQAGAQIRWYQIRPELTPWYQNANFPWESKPYQWIGFAKIQYAKEELAQFRDQWEIQPFTHAENPGILDALGSWLWSFGGAPGHSSYYHQDAGSFWFQVEIERNGKISYSPGIEDSDERGLSPKVLRVSIRDGEGYLGYLTSFFNVPGLFGSIPYQSHNYIGADCADVLIAAHARWKNRQMSKDYNVAMVVNSFPQRAEFNLIGGTPDQEIRWGNEISPGDFIAVRYSGGRQYQHIGALAQDANQNGRLDRQDIVLHAGPAPLHYSALQEGNFDGHVVILRP